MSAFLGSLQEKKMHMGFLREGDVAPALPW